MVFNELHNSVVVEEAIKKARHYCSTQERCIFDIQNKLRQWGLNEQDFNQIIESLVEEDFLNEKRFVETYVLSKLNLKKWGKIKIRYELLKRKIPENLIESGFDNIDSDLYHAILAKIILKKKDKIRETDLYKAQKKLATFAISKGYETGIVWDTIKRLIQ